MDEYLRLLKYNQSIREQRDSWRRKCKISRWVLFILVFALVILIIQLTYAGQDIKKYKTVQNAMIEATVSAPYIPGEVVFKLTGELSEKDNEISQLKDRIAFLSFLQAMYEEEEEPIEEEKKVIIGTNWREYVNLFTIGQQVPLPDAETNTFRCMDYHKITDITSWQYKIQQNSYTDINGLRYYSHNGEKYYTVALATAYGIDIGNAYKVELENGTIFNIIHGEYKHDIRYPRPDDFGDADVNYDGEDTISVIEFIYDHANAPAGLIGDGEANRYLGEGCDIYGDGCNIKSMTYLGKIWTVN